MRKQQSEKVADKTSETLTNQRPTWIYRHVHTWLVAQNSLWQPITSGHNCPLLQACTWCVNFKENCTTFHAFRLRPLDYTIRSTSWPANRYWHKVRERVNQSPLQLSWVEAPQKSRFIAKQMGRANCRRKRWFCKHAITWLSPSATGTVLWNCLHTYSIPRSSTPLERFRSSSCCRDICLARWPSTAHQHFQQMVDTWLYLPSLKPGCFIALQWCERKLTKW